MQIMLSCIWIILKMNSSLSLKMFHLTPKLWCFAVCSPNNIGPLWILLFGPNLFFKMKSVSYIWNHMWINSSPKNILKLSLTSSLVSYFFWSLGVAAGGPKISINLRNHILCSIFFSQWNLYAVCTTQYLLGFHVCAGEDPLYVTHIKQGFREPRVQSLTSFAAECESWLCERELWLAYVCLWRPQNGGEDTNKTQLVWTAPSPAGTVCPLWWKDPLKRWFESSVQVIPIPKTQIWSAYALIMLIISLSKGKSCRML